MHLQASSTLLRINHLRCTWRTSPLGIGAMASPNIFLSSPSGSSRQKSRFFNSSSPLPPVHDIVSKTSNNAPFRLNKKTSLNFDSNEIVDPTPKDHMSQVQPPKQAIGDSDITTEHEDSSICIIEAPQNFSAKMRKPRQKESATEKQKKPLNDATLVVSPSNDQPWKKFVARSYDPENGRNLSEKEKSNGTIITRQPNEDLTEPPDSPSKEAQKPKPFMQNANEPLYLESAITRRLEWTPPNPKAAIILDSDSSTTKDSSSLAGRDEATKSFEQILESYKCVEDIRKDVAIASDEDSSFLRKRKLIELVTAQMSVPSPIDDKEKSPIKRKAPKKKARTITELATAAYRAQSPQADLGSANTLPLDRVSNEMTNEDSGEVERKGKGKGKAKPKKKASKALKKKAQPPKPSLLPPIEALQEAAKQDFVFGTSSQLAIENSPTFLRDLQAAIKHSNQLEYIELDTPLNSDAIEPGEHKPRLWDAGARDIDGDLFDLEVRKMAEGSSQPLPAATSEEDDPFGYFRNANNPVFTSNHGQPKDSLLDDPFADTPDKPSPELRPIDIIDDSLSESELSHGSPRYQSTMATANKHEMVTEPNSLQPSRVNSANAPKQTEYPVSLPKPTYGTYTDAQLSKEITSYGFKSVKSRQAKIALLEQCWQSKFQMSHSTVRTMATGPSGPSGSAVTPEGKRPRGRPRKNSVNASDPQEPPPSAQPRESPKISRKQTTKTATAKAGGSKAPSKKKAASKTKETPSTPKPKARRKKVVIEIPDSASDCGSDVSLTPRSSPERMFSSPSGVDLSHPMIDETDPSMTLDSSNDPSLVFEYITKVVKTTPRTTDPENPSWHEKILLYDPIILEDLTAWLNSGQLTQVGYDGEVAASDVKKWCESNSICCLWKVNLRGKERKRY